MGLASDTRTAQLTGAALVVVLLLGLYGMNGRAINSVDTNVIQHTALSLAATGSADLSSYDTVVVSGLDMGYVAIVDGQALSSYPLLPALLAAPAYALAVTAGTIDPVAPDRGRVEAVGSAVAALLTALACGVLCLFLSRSASPPMAVAVALACGLGTPLWSSASQALWGHAPAALLLALGLTATLDASDTPGSHPRVWLGGLALVLAVFCRQLLIVFPLGVLVGFWCAGHRRSLAPLLLGFASGAALMFLANSLWLGSPLGGFLQLYSSGVSARTHGVAGAWEGRWLWGLAGILASPSRGLVVYMPVALLALAGAAVAWRRPMLRCGVLLPTAAFVVIWAKYAVWWGGHSFGPRFAADIAVPLAILGAGAPAVLGRLPSFARAGAAVAAGLVVAWSIGVQGVGAFYYPAGDWNGGPRDVDHAHDRLWDWRDPQIVRTVTSGTYRAYRARQQAEPTPLEAGADALMVEAE